MASTRYFDDITLAQTYDRTIYEQRARELTMSGHRDVPKQYVWGATQGIKIAEETPKANTLLLLEDI